MFAEELSGSAARKRQEDARRRRRELQQKKKREEQQKKKEEERQAAAAASASAASVSAPDAPADAARNDGDREETPAASATTTASPARADAGGARPSAALPRAIPPTTAPSSSSEPKSAVEIAKEQRLLRQRQKAERTSAIKIQSLYRSRRTRKELLTKEGALLESRLSDLEKVRTVLKDARGEEYVCPPATSSSLVLSALFAYRSDAGRSGRPGKSRIDAARLLEKTLRHAVLPGVESEDVELDPVIPWLGSPEGRLRLKRLLAACWHSVAVVSATGSGTNSKGGSGLLEVVDLFLRGMVGLQKTKRDEKGEAEKGGSIDAARRRRSREELHAFCRPLLFPSRPSSDQSASETAEKFAYLLKNRGSGDLDLTRFLRTLLLFNTGGKDPIPIDAEKLREGSISPGDRRRASVVFGLLVDGIASSTSPGGSAAEKRVLQARMVNEIFTVPLLSWKITPGTISMLVLDHGERGKDQPRDPLLVSFLRSYAETHAGPLSAGEIGAVMPREDVPLTVCPATGPLCLLANIVQMGRMCVSVNGFDPTKINFAAAGFFFDMVAALVDVVPLGAFSERRSAVEWVTHGTSAHHTPIVLSNVVLDQCKALLVDSFVRGLFGCAINDVILNTDRIVEAKNEKDLKHEKDMAAVGGESSASLAAKEAMIERKKSFWQSSKWARKLSKSVTSLLSSDSSQKPQSKKPKGLGKLVDTSAVSRQLANGKGPKQTTIPVERSTDEGASSASQSSSPYDKRFLFALCGTYGAVLSRWGGGGSEDLVKVAVPAGDKAGGVANATSKPEPCVLSLLNVLCFSTPALKSLWALTQADPSVIADIHAVIDADKSSNPIRTLSLRPQFGMHAASQKGPGTTGAAVLLVFICALSHTLIVTDDCEVHDMSKPLPLHQLRRCILLLKNLLYRACCVDDFHTSSSATLESSNHFGLSLISSSSKAMRDLYDRSSRRPLCLPKMWLVEDLLDKDVRRCKSHEDYVALLKTPVLRVCPFLVPFKRRLKLFERIVTTDRIRTQGSNEEHNLRPGIVVHVMRGRVLEDGLLHLNKLGRNLRQRLVIQYLNQAGAKETGVDVGGLFKEFWTDLSALAFNPDFALFRVTEDSGNLLFPNPSSGFAHGQDHLVLFEFLGRILGKALYEGIVIQPQFAHFFLSFIRGDYNFLHMLSDLGTMDPQLYNNLMFLKTYEGDAGDLSLTFTVASDDFGTTREIPLIPNGANIEVTNSNKQRYIGLVAKYYVCDRLKEQSMAFTRGLWDVIDSRWLRLFNEGELQVLISGATDGKIDIADLKANARYTGGYTGLDKNVFRFWNVVRSFNSKQQASLLRFVTSCERPPPLGFSSMNPPFTIQRVGIMRDADKLPTASTCFNILKLPTYSSEKVLRERLLYAIEAGAGFELT